MRGASTKFKKKSSPELFVVQQELNKQVQKFNGRYFLGYNIREKSLKKLDPSQKLWIASENYEQMGTLMLFQSLQ